MVTVLANATASTSSPVIQEPATEQYKVFTDYELPPPSLDAAWKTAPIIVRGTVQASAVRERHAPNAPVPIPITEHRLKVLEVFKGAGLIGPVAELIVEQDTVEPAASPRGVAHGSGGRVFKPSEEYVLFLEGLPGQRALTIAWGPWGAYRMRADTVRVASGADRMWQFRNEISREELLNALRSRRDKSPVK
jgi:hypothetical protein